MKNKNNKKIALLLCMAWFVSIQAFATNISGLISTNTVWTLANSPYIVTGNILVNAGVTLTIQPGVTVKFNSKLSMQIDGMLLAQGTSSNKITFTSNTTQAAGAWGYIYFSDKSADAVFENNINGKYLSGSILEYCIIQYAGGTSVSDNGALRLDAAHPFVNYCNITNNLASGIKAYNISEGLKITNSTISNNTSPRGAGINFSHGWNVNGNSVISGNTISNNYATISTQNYAESAGGGIYIWIGNNNTVTISNNIITTNTAFDGGGICNAYHGSAVISYNIILNNVAERGGGINNNNSAGSADISSNIISKNTSSSLGGGVISGGSALSHNVIADNTASSLGGGVYSHFSESYILNNHIIRNIANDAAGIYYNNSYKKIQFNTVAYNINTDFNKTLNSIFYVELSNQSEINNNNIYRNSAFYELYDNDAQGGLNIRATNNWWGTTNEAEIQAKIYDWFDNNSKGIVNYSPYLTTPDTKAPVSPPVNVTKTKLVGGQMKIDWDHNPESDIAGYHLYYGGFNGYSFTNIIDAGNNTSYILSGVSVTDTIAITAYDNTYNIENENKSTIVNDNMTNGNESWFTYAKLMLTMTSFEVLPASGGNALGNGGSVSYTVGQTIYTTDLGTNGLVAKGVQQPFEISVYVTGLEEANWISLFCSVYPIPTTEYVTLKLENHKTENLTYELYDINGKLLENKKIESNETKIVMNNLVSATYFLKVIQGNKEIKTFKIIKN